MSRRLVTCLFGVALLLAGCSKSGVGKVSGQVLLDGEKVAGADVRFVPKDDLTLGEFGGRTDAEGKFSITVGSPGMNARPGKYVVLITKGTIPGMSPVPSKPPKTEDELKEAMKATAPGLSTGGLPPRYGLKDFSPFQVEIKAGTNELAPFELTRKQ